MKFTCLIPFYNEGKRTLSVLKELTKIKDLFKIICIDDGSADSSYLLIRKYFPQVKLIRFKKNRGKSEAIKRGLESVKTNYVFLIDSDLRNINLNNITTALKFIKKDNSIDMIIFRDRKIPKMVDILAKKIRSDILFSGERILKTSDLIKVFKRLNPQGYQLEFAINRYMMEKNKKIFSFPGIGYNPIKSEKDDFSQGLYLDMLANYKLLKYTGLTGWYKQYRLFCKDEYNSLI